MIKHSEILDVRCYSPNLWQLGKIASSFQFMLINYYLQYVSDNNLNLKIKTITLQSNIFWIIVDLI